ncbi:hypothetical protein [Agrococcus baldri]|uniref:hypothetical protein n=1 Tax=Agrococcus baldri TaxID=153730 RepID=UPI0011BE03EE|nr:hypothetical protein [Agrococcus baldri]
MAHPLEELRTASGVSGVPDIVPESVAMRHAGQTDSKESVMQVSEHPTDCEGTLQRVPNNDRSIADPASRFKWVCDADESHVYQDDDTMPFDRSRTFGE